MSAIARLAAALALIASPALAVGLGPLSIDGVTDGPGKAFRLHLYNPYPRAEHFVVTPIGWDDEAPAGRVTLLPADARIGANGQRIVLVIAQGLAPGETYRFRVCGERADASQKEIVRARVCAKLVARRLP